MPDYYNFSTNGYQAQTTNYTVFTSNQMFAGTTTYVGQQIAAPAVYAGTGYMVSHGHPRGVPDEAKERARELLLAHLDDDQRAEYEDRKQFHVQTADGERKYRIEWGHAGNVRLIEDDRAVRRFCLHPTEPFANEDTMLAQKMLLETDEDEFLRLANATAW